MASFLFFVIFYTALLATVTEGYRVYRVHGFRPAHRLRLFSGSENTISGQQPPTETETDLFRERVSALLGEGSSPLVDLLGREYALAMSQAEFNLKRLRNARNVTVDHYQSLLAPLTQRFVLEQFFQEVASQCQHNQTIQALLKEKNVKLTAKVLSQKRLFAEFLLDNEDVRELAWLALDVPVSISLPPPHVMHGGLSDLLSNPGGGMVHVGERAPLDYRRLMEFLSGRYNLKLTSCSKDGTIYEFYDGSFYED